MAAWGEGGGDPSPPLAPFASPLPGDPQLERFLSDAVRLLGDWIGASASAAPLPALSVLPSPEPQSEGLSRQQLLADLQQVMEGAYRPHHPGALAHLDPPPLSASIAAELIGAGINNNLLAEELSPSLSRLERSLCAWLATSLGLPAGAGGVAASGGSLSNLMALVTARHHAGLGCDNRAVVVCSADAHVSLQKALVVMGLPADSLIRVPGDARGALRVDGLTTTLSALERAGRPVLAVVATAGTTVRGAIDPLAAMASLCRARGLWLHVDGAIGAVFGLLPEPPAELTGLGLADSLTVNPQKLLGITKTSSLLLLAEPARLGQTFGTGLPYMEPSWGGGHGGEAGLPGSRPAEVLKLWLGLRHLGLQGIHDLLQAARGRCRQLEALLAADDRLLLRSGPLHLLAFRPQQADAAGCAAWSARTRQLLLDHQLMLSRPHYQGLHHLKAVLGNPHTGESHLRQLAELILRSLDQETSDG
ncbi:MAG: pyridoxal phosphate-dependent decarboxylase family protein [Synechococcaceae cyanobacterium]